MYFWAAGRVLNLCSHCLPLFSQTMMQPMTTTTISTMTPVSFKFSLEARLYCSCFSGITNTFSDLFLGDDTADTGSFGKYLAVLECNKIHLLKHCTWGQIWGTPFYTSYLLHSVIETNIVLLLHYICILVL